MRRRTLAIGVIAVTLLATLAVGGSASAECVEPTPNPTQTATDITVQIGDATPAPSSSTSCAPTPSGAPIPSPTPSSTAAPGPGASNGNGNANGNSKPGKPRKAKVQLPTETVQTASAGAPDAPVPASRPSDDASTLTLEPTRVEAGADIQATASGFTPGEQVQLVLYPSPLIIGSYAADESGAIDIVFEVPTDTRTGTHVAEVTGWDSETEANGEFVVTAAPDIAGGMPTMWWLLGILLLLLLAAIVVAIGYRSSIASIFAGSRAPEVAS